MYLDARVEFKKDLGKNMKKNTKPFFRYARSCVKSRDGVENVKLITGETVSNTDQIAVALK